MRCISLVSYFVVFKGDVISLMVPSKGLKQGELLSTYLFYVLKIYLCLLGKLKVVG